MSKISAPNSASVSRLIFPADAVLDRWRTWRPMDKGLEAAVSREFRWQQSGQRSNCPVARSPVDWDEITPDCSVVMAYRVEKFFELHLEFHPQKGAVLAGMVSPEFWAAWLAWYALNPVFRPVRKASKNDGMDQPRELIDLVREWNARNPGDAVTYDGIRKAIQQKRLVTRCTGRPQKATLAEVALWRAETQHGGKRDASEEQVAA